MNDNMLSINKSKNGRGVFTKKDFKAGELVVELKGKLITCYVDDDIDDETRSNTIRYSDEKFLSPKGELGEMINHSCNPNSKLVKKGKKLFVIAIEPILKNKEVLFDYSTIIARDDIWTMKCNCGSKNCRKVIKRFNLLPKKIQSDYIKYKIVPSYILNIK